MSRFKLFAMKYRQVLAPLCLFTVACGQQENTGTAAGATAGDVGQPAGQAQPAESQSENATGVKVIQVTGGGPVIQILPGPFPFPDSAAPVIAQRPEDQRQKLEAQVKQGPYSNNVAPIAGTSPSPRGTGDPPGIQWRGRRSSRRRTGRTGGWS